jgi:hypothetical protein
MKKSFLTFEKVCLSIKNNLPVLLSKVFNRANLNKAIIIFIVGLITRIFIGLNYNINVFSDYFNSVSISYYISFSFFIVLVHELVPYFDIDIIPSFLTNLYSIIRNNIIYTYNNICYINKFIFSLKLKDFSISSIRKVTRDNIEDIIKNNFTVKVNSNNITPASLDEEQIITPNTDNKKSNVLHMDESSDNEKESITIGYKGSITNIGNIEQSPNINPVNRPVIGLNYGYDERYVEINPDSPLFNGPSGFSTPSTMEPIFQVESSRASSENGNSKQKGVIGIINRQFNFTSRPNNLLSANEIHRSNNLPRVTSTRVNVSSVVNENNAFGHDYPLPGEVPYFNPSINESINSNHATMGLNSSNENM